MNPEQNPGQSSEKPAFSELYDQDPAIAMARRVGITETTSGPAFTLWFKAFTLMLLAVMAYMGWPALNALDFKSMPVQSHLILWGGIAIVLYTAFHIMVSRTTITPTHIEQRFVFTRRMHLGELSFAKFIYIPYLTWLIAPRLYVRSAQNKFMAIYGASHALHVQFGLIHRVVNQKVE